MPASKSAKRLRHLPTAEPALRTGPTTSMAAEECVVGVKGGQRSVEPHAPR